MLHNFLIFLQHIHNFKSLLLFYNSKQLIKTMLNVEFVIIGTNHAFKIGMKVENSKYDIKYTF